ncbi:hypothetical protein [Chryseobacterium gambrini]|uniref:hypothetical protein n=1 Tax=Chryseobacterium gambrini TaxID=373672 RepID=UPI0022F401E1|nr:hypothetical protein [Chryseobacterium gambrini]WBX97827.1 hypothetical protein PE065_00915 [Chryseobacterium gambrini]
MKPKYITKVPDQQKGSFHDTESVRTSKKDENTSDNFKILKDRLLSVNYWNYYAHGIVADFKLHDAEGNLKKSLPEKGDFIRIDIPGPGNFEARGFDWVQITDIYDGQSEEADILEMFLIECRPSQVPGKATSNTAHFYTSEATSSFAIFRGVDFIKFGIYGRNESPNMEVNLADKARNLSIALGGMVGLSKIHWKVLAETFVEF